MTDRNEAAERLIENAMKIGLIDIRKLMDAALAAERDLSRRATVERCWIEAQAHAWDFKPGDPAVSLDALRMGFAAILDEEAAR